MCGENVDDPPRQNQGAGSSPRVRGKLEVGLGGGGGLGLIPACAGKTPTHLSYYGQYGVHPRVCGENLGKMFFQIAASGSSPRVRGKLP